VSVQPDGLEGVGATSPPSYGVAVDHDGFYAPGVGMIEAISLTGPSEDIQLSTIEHGV